MVRKFLWWIVKLPPDMTVILYLTWKSSWLLTGSQETTWRRLIFSLVFTEIYSFSFFLSSLWNQVSLILKCCASRPTVALLENRPRHASFNKTNWSCAGRSKALYNTVVLVRMGEGALVGDTGYTDEFTPRIYPIDCLNPF